MGIEYGIIAMDNSVRQNMVLNAFSPYCTKVNDEEYSLDYGDEIYNDKIISNSCTLIFSFDEEDESIVSSIDILSPCDHIELEKAIYSLIHQYPMIFTCSDFPLMTANKKCMDLLKEEDLETFEETTLVTSFDEFSSLLV